MHARARLDRRGSPTLEHLSRVEDPVRVEQALDAAHQRQEVAVLELERLQLAATDAVLARARAAAGQGIDDEAFDELVGARHLVRVVDVDLEADVHVAVAGVAENGGLEAEALRLAARKLDRARQLGDRDAGVGRSLVAAGRGSRRRVRGGVTDMMPAGASGARRACGRPEHRRRGAARRGYAASHRGARFSAWISRMRSSQALVLARARRRLAGLPRVIARAADAEHAAHRLDRVLGLLRRDEPEDHRRVSLSLAKKAAAFLRISRSSVSVRTSRRKRRSSSRSSEVRPSAWPSSTSTCRDQLRSDCGEHPSSRDELRDRAAARPQQPDRLAAELQRIRRG